MHACRRSGRNRSLPRALPAHISPRGIRNATQCTSSFDALLRTGRDTPREPVSQAAEWCTADYRQASSAPFKTSIPCRNPLLLSAVDPTVGTETQMVSGLRANTFTTPIVQPVGALFTENGRRHRIASAVDHGDLPTFFLTSDRVRFVRWRLARRNPADSVGSSARVPISL